MYKEGNKMTNRLKEAITNTTLKQEVPFDNQLILDWMDDKVYKLEAIKDIFAGSPDMIGIGSYDEVTERHTHQIETCSWVPTTLDEVHVYRGLPLLAGAAGLEIKTKPHTAKSVCHYIEYKGVEFFELTEAGETLR